jgi:capsular polysaccharide biosynthesis protein
MVNGRRTTVEDGANPTNSESGSHAFDEVLDREYTLSLRSLVLTIRRQLWLILLVTCGLTGSVLGITLMVTPTYEASIRMLIGQEQGTGAPGSLGSDVQGLEQLTRTVAEAVDSEPVAETVIQRLGLQMTPKEFGQHLSVEQIPQTQFIQVSYTDSSAEQAQQVVNAVGDVAAAQVSEVSLSANSIAATVWQRANVPEEPVSPNVVLNVVLSLVIGFMLGVVVAFLLEYLAPGGVSWRK